MPTTKVPPTEKTSLKAIPSAGPSRGGGRAYLRLAETLRRRILYGVYQPGDRIPTETDLSRDSGLSPLTVRQALGLLVDEGLLERFIGRGTFVRRLDWRRASFGIDGLIKEIGRPGAKVKIVRTEVIRASGDLAAALGLAAGDPVIHLKRTISTPQAVCLVQESHLKPDFRQPVMEAELEATYLAGIFNGGGRGLIKSAELSVVPAVLGGEDAALLGAEPGTAAFRLDYVFLGASSPLAVGFFTIPGGALRLTSTIGVRPPDPGEDPGDPAPGAGSPQEGGR